MSVPYQDSLYCFAPPFVQPIGLNRRKDIPNLFLVIHDEWRIAVVGEGDEPSNFKRTSLGAGAACCGEGFLSDEILISVDRCGNNSDTVDLMPNPSRELL